MNPEDVDWREAFKKEITFGEIKSRRTWTWIRLPASLSGYSQAFDGSRFYFLQNFVVKSIDLDGSIHSCRVSNYHPRVGHDGSVYYSDFSHQLRNIVTGEAVSKGMIEGVFPSWPKPGLWRTKQDGNYVTDPDGKVVSQYTTIIHWFRDGFVKQATKLWWERECCVGPNHLVFNSGLLWCRPMNRVGRYPGIPHKHFYPKEAGFFRVNLTKKIDFFFGGGLMEGNPAVVVKAEGSVWLVVQDRPGD